MDPNAGYEVLREGLEVLSVRPSSASSAPRTPPLPGSFDASPRHNARMLATPSSVPRSVVSTPSTGFGGSPAFPMARSGSITSLGFPVSPDPSNSPPSRAASDGTLSQSSSEPGDMTLMGRKGSAASIPIIFQPAGDAEPSHSIGLGLELGTPENRIAPPAGSMLQLLPPALADGMARNLSIESSESSSSTDSYRRLSAVSAVTASTVTEPTEPPTPVDRRFGSHRDSLASRFSVSDYCYRPASTSRMSAGPRTLLAAAEIRPKDKARSQSTQVSTAPRHGSVPSGPSRPRAITLTSAPLLRTVALPSVDELTPPPDAMPPPPPPPSNGARSRSKTVADSVYVPPKLTDRQRNLFGDAYKPVASGSGQLSSVGALGMQYGYPTPDPSPHPPLPPSTSTAAPTATLLGRLKTPPSRFEDRSLAERRGSPPQIPIHVPRPRSSSLSPQSRRKAGLPSRPGTAQSGRSSNVPSRPGTAASVGPRSADPPGSSRTVSFSQPTPSTSSPASYFSPAQTLFHSTNSSTEDLPVGELFRRLELWFDQEGFREIAPSFEFECYSRADDLAYFTTPRAQYPYHYDSMQQAPRLRRVVAPDYEEAYASLEGQSRNAGGRRDFVSQQATLNMKDVGTYMIEGKEGRSKQWTWRLRYDVEERKSLDGKVLHGERYLVPVSFACSPEILDPSHASRASVFRSIMKTIGPKRVAVQLDASGQPMTRPRGKSLGARGSARGRSDSTSYLLGSPRHPASVVSSDSMLGSPTPASPATSMGPTGSAQQEKRAEDASRVQHLFQTISPASASPLRPTTASSNARPSFLRKYKTTEHLRRPATADPCPPPAMPFPSSLFGIAQQPSRATPTRPKTGTDDRRMAVGGRSIGPSTPL